MKLKSWVGYQQPLFFRLQKCKFELKVRQNKEQLYRFFYLFIFLLAGISNNCAQNKALGLDLVVIDAGHGGKDPGAIGVTGLREKDVALSVALKVGEKIINSYPNVKVVYTRSDDKFVELSERASIANRLNADLFISIHANSATSASPSGTETWVLGLHKSEAALEVAKRENASILMEDNYETTYQDFDPSDPEAYISLSLRQHAYLDHSLNFASQIQTNFRDNLQRKDRGVKQAGFIVLFRTTMPAVLVELGFLSNAKEESYLRSEKGRKELANGIYEAFVDYKTNIDGVNHQVEATSIWFGVQLVTSKKEKDPVPGNFADLPDIKKFKSGKFWKYTSGSFSKFEDATSLMKKARMKGYRDAFVVAFDGLDQISVSEAKKRLTEF